MVVFTCGHCGESVQKPKVEKHYLTKCRNRNPNLSCMDCFKDFYGIDYDAHTKCISEEQRYSGKGFVAKVNKGEQKQNTWVELVQSVLDEETNAPRNVLRILEEVAKHNNTPRKRPKFINFVKNTCGHRTLPKDIDSAWNLISVKLAALSITNKANNSLTKSKTTQDIKSGGDIVTNGNGKVESKDKEGVHSSGDEHGQAEEENVGDETGCENEVPGMETNGKDEQNAEKFSKRTHSKENGQTKKQIKKIKKMQKYDMELQKASEEFPDEPAANEHREAKEKNVGDEPICENEVSGMKTNCKDNKNVEKVSKGIHSKENGHTKKQLKKMKKMQKYEMELQKVSEEFPDEPATNQTDERKKKSKKRKHQEINSFEEVKKSKTDKEEPMSLHEQNIASNDNETREKFMWHDFIISCLQKKGNELQYNRLQKKVLAAYIELTGKEANERIMDKLTKKIKSTPNVKIDKNKVILLE